MLLIDCPYCGEARPELEFSYAGEAHIERAADPTVITDTQWAEYLYVRSNTCGPHREGWRQTHACGRFFNALRNTVTDQLIASYQQDEHAQD